MAVRVVAFEAVMAALELQTDLLLHGARTTVTLTRRKLLLPQIAGLHDVIVDGDDQRKVFLSRGDTGRRIRAHTSSVLPDTSSGRTQRGTMVQ